MKNIRKYGNPPFDVAVIHGGPGAGGEMASLARELADEHGVLEPIQTEASLAGQVKELKSVLESHGSVPVILVGFSWGAWLSFILAARYPETAKKLILVSSGPFEDDYVKNIDDTRRDRLSLNEKKEFDCALMSLKNPDSGNKDQFLSRLGDLVSITDNYDLTGALSDDPDTIPLNGDIYQKVWKNADELRSNGDLLNLAHRIKCPVTAIHGDYDPHPAEGVRKPLSSAVKDFRFHLLENCGHTPWKERQAADNFYRILKKELINRRYSSRGCFPSL